MVEWLTLCSTRCPIQMTPMLEPVRIVHEGHDGMMDQRSNSSLCLALSGQRYLAMENDPLIEFYRQHSHSIQTPFIAESEFPIAVFDHRRIFKVCMRHCILFRMKMLVLDNPAAAFPVVLSQLGIPLDFGKV